MARQIVTLVLIFFAVVGMASASPNQTPSKPADAPSAVIGTTGGGDHGAAPVAGPVGTGTLPTIEGSSPAEAPANGASALEISTVAATVAAASFFFL